MVKNFGFILFSMFIRAVGCCRRFVGDSHHCVHEFGVKCQTTAITSNLNDPFEIKNHFCFCINVNVWKRDRHEKKEI